MKKLNNKDLLLASYFIPSSLKNIQVTDKDKQMFVEWSSEGKHKELVKLSHFSDGFNALIYGKKYAGITMGLWEEGIIEGSNCYFTLLGGYQGRKRTKLERLLGREEYAHKPIPKMIVEHMKKEMFKGMDSDIIDKIYKTLI